MILIFYSPCLFFHLIQVQLDVLCLNEDLGQYFPRLPYSLGEHWRNSTVSFLCIFCFVCLISSYVAVIDRIELFKGDCYCHHLTLFLHHSKLFLRFSSLLLLVHSPFHTQTLLYYLIQLDHLDHFSVLNHIFWYLIGCSDFINLIHWFSIFLLFYILQLIIVHFPCLLAVFSHLHLVYLSFKSWFQSLTTITHTFHHQN